MKVLKGVCTWFIVEYVKDYRESSTRIYDLIVKTSAQINQIILTVSVASLAVIAALNKAVFVPYGALALVAISLFVVVILLSVVNLYLSISSLADIRRKLNRNLSSISRLNKNMELYKFKSTQKLLGLIVLVGFCSGLIALLVLLGLYILGASS